MKQDLRVVKSQIAIENAFINLVGIKGMPNVSIKEIAEKAMVNRNTIYMNYGSKEGILESIINHSIEKYFGRLDSDEYKKLGYSKRKIEHVFRNMFKAINENIELYRIILTDNASTGYLETELSIIRKKITSIFKPTLENELTFSFIISGVWGIVSQYIIYAKGTEEQNIKILTDLAASNLRHLSYTK